MGVDVACGARGRSGGAPCGPLGGGGAGLEGGGGGPRGGPVGGPSGGPARPLPRPRPVIFLNYSKIFFTDVLRSTFKWRMKIEN